MEITDPSCCFSCLVPAEKSGGRIKPSNTQGPVGAGTCSALLEECNQYFSSPKAGLLFFLYLMSFHAATSLAALFCLCPWARSILLQLIFQSESLRVRATPLSFPCCGKHPGEDHPLCLEEEPAPVLLQHLPRHPRGCTAGSRKPLELLFGGQHWEELLAGDVVCGKRSAEPEGGMSWGSSRALPEHPAPQIRAAIHLREMGTAQPRDYSSCTGQPQ